jgi:hypothetical protein
MANNTFARNIVYYRTGTLIRVGGWHDKVLSECDGNLYWQVGADLAADPKLTPKGTLAQWQAAGYDKNSVVADPLFVDPAKDDYRLKPESPALKLGFKAIDVGKIGAQGYIRPSGRP